jgi:hypothetical protein
MFNFFKSRQEPAKELMDKSWMKDVSDTGHVEPSKVETTPAPVYQIGRTEDGRITFRIGDGYVHSTLTMNTSAVKRLIRMLEVSVEEDTE